MSRSMSPEDEYDSLNEKDLTVINKDLESDISVYDTYGRSLSNSQENIRTIVSPVTTPVDITPVNEESDLNKRAASFLNDIATESVIIYANELEAIAKSEKEDIEKRFNETKQANRELSEIEPNKVRKLRELFTQKSENITSTKSSESEKVDIKKSDQSGSSSSSQSSVTKLKDLFEKNPLSDINTKSNETDVVVEEVEDIMPRINSKVVTEVGDTVTISKPPKYKQIDEVIQYREPLPLPPESPKAHPVEEGEVSIKPMPNPPSDLFTARLSRNTSPMVSLNLPCRSRSLTSHYHSHCHHDHNKVERRGSITMRSISPCPVNFPFETKDTCKFEKESPPIKDMKQERIINYSKDVSNTPSYSRRSRIDEQYYALKQSGDDCPSPVAHDIVPDGVYIRTGEVYERIDDGITSKPLGHWVTTILNQNGATQMSYPPMTQITNIWVSPKDVNRTAYKYEYEKSDEMVDRYQQIPLSHNRTLVLKETPPMAPTRKSMMYSSLPTRGSNRRRSQITMKDVEQTSGNHHQSKQRYSRSPSPTHSWLSWTSLSPPPPYRTRSLSSWGGEVGLGPTAAWKYQQRQCTRGRTPTRSVSFYERSISRKQTGSPSPLFHSPEQVEKRIKELKSETRRHYDDLYYGEQFMEKSGAYQMNPGLSVSHSPSNQLNKTNAISEPKYINTNLDDNESGVDYSPITKDFGNKCAYFDRISRYNNAQYCSCFLHCPMYRKSQNKVQADLSKAPNVAPSQKSCFDTDSGFVAGSEIHQQVESPPIEPVKAKLVYNTNPPKKSESCNDFNAINKDSIFRKYDSVRDLIKRYDTISHHNVNYNGKIKKFSYIST